MSRLVLLRRHYRSGVQRRWCTCTSPVRQRSSQPDRRSRRILESSEVELWWLAKQAIRVSTDKPRQRKRYDWWTASPLQAPGRLLDRGVCK